MKKINLSDNLFVGEISLIRRNGWIQPLRIKAEDVPLHNEILVERAATSGGCRLRFRTTAIDLALTVEPAESAGSRLFDLTGRDGFIRTFSLNSGAAEVRFNQLPPGRKILELWLPMRHEVKIRTLAIDEEAELNACPDPRPKWVTYGSSITHCGEAHSPARTWPAVAARLGGFNLTCLGFGGQCHMDPLMAMTIRDLKADFISLKVGINMVGGSVSSRTFRPLLIGMVKIIREKHSRTPMAVISPIISPPRETAPGPTGMTLQVMRRELALAVERMRECGDENIHYFSGLDLFGEELVADYLPDLLHPNGDGYEIMGRNFAQKIMALIMN